MYVYIKQAIDCLLIWTILKLKEFSNGKSKLSLTI